MLHPVHLMKVQQHQVATHLCTKLSSYTAKNAAGLGISHYSVHIHQGHFISARQHICYSALYVIARPSVHLSVCPSVRHTGGSVKDV